ncbi:hypothetical protein [Sulfitobacter guttiformis]|uniref:Uncharacterized protein n=1 Tax=Sulfitobacter guttiformis TaxID=74349 RepID=A0A420DHQ1_9RHOB|nr:hypothetical protein [Sulfitobacter guttiformis]RKE93749.1 hypothetical protein C8N30_2843 [Sulfitobacter guttiformis]
MKIDISKLLALKGSEAARSPKVGFPPEPDAPIRSKLLMLRGSEAARSAKVGVPEPI